jgi:hypothetical protein
MRVVSRLRAVVVMLVVTGPIVIAPTQASAPPAFRLIVNPANGATAVERRFVLEAFLKKTTRWPDGSLIRPVDENAESTSRQRFSDELLGRSVSAVKSYWQQAVFAGRDLPPPELDSDDDVVRYVLRYAGAIGYVSGVANIERVKVLSVR